MIAWDAEGRLRGGSEVGGQVKEDWDSFFRARNGQAIEWYSRWTDLQGYLGMLMPKSTQSYNAVKILVAGCGNSELSAHMYDVGWKDITNIDFSKVVIAEMLRLHVRSRPNMRWQVMDITHLQFADASFDVVLDKGGLDSLMADATQSSLLARTYLSEVKRVLRVGGKYACVTVAHNDVLGLLLETFREGWLIYVHKILLVSNSSDLQLHPYLIYAMKSCTEEIAPVKCFFGKTKNGYAEPQMQLILDLIDKENRLRNEGGFCNTSDLFSRLHPGRRMPLKLGRHYPAVILDSKPDAEPPVLRCGVFLVPKSRAREWLFSSEEGQWQVLETAQAGRLILVMLDAHQTDTVDIKQELSPLVEPLLPLDLRGSDTILYMTTNDVFTQTILLEEIDSRTTGTIHVEEVVDLSEDTLTSLAEEIKPRHYRRLVFRRNPNLIQSEASLIPVKAYSKERQHSKRGVAVVRRHNGNKKKHRAKGSVLNLRTGLKELQVDFSYLASEYHAGIISGLCLIAHNLEEWIFAKAPVRAMIVGLGAGLLPMFMYNHIPVSVIQVVELDGVVADLAKRHFGFVEDERMQLCISDGIEAVDAIARRNPDNSTLPCNPLLEENGSRVSMYTSENREADYAEEVLAAPSNAYEIHGLCRGSSNKDEKLHILIIDADSSDPSTGLSCPPAEFLEEPFLRSAREILVDGGILAINVVSRASSPHITSIALLQKVFEEVYDLEIEENVNRVLFALPRHSQSSQDCQKDGQMHVEVMETATICFERLVGTFAPWGNGPSVKDHIKRLKRLK